MIQKGTALKLAKELASKDTDQCINWPGSKSRGYGFTTSRRGGKHRHVKISRFVYSLRGVWPDNNHVLHTCDNPACINPKHLELGSQSKNMKDCFKRGRLNNAMKLSRDQVETILKLSGSMPQSRIAEKVGCSQSHVSLIVNSRRRNSQ